jgi:twitching motility protein PilT
MSADLAYLLKSMIERGASDLHLRAVSPPILRIEGKLALTDDPPLSIEEVDNITQSIMNDTQKENFQVKQSIDTSYSVPGVGRFRMNIFRQRGTTSLVARSIPFTIPTIESLGLPQIIKSFCGKPQGLMLVTGPTGSGKSSTLAAMVEVINETKNLHIVTIEDPIEFLFKNKNSFISQREVGIDTPSFSDALKDALRQDPDIILIGEMRDIETTSIALNAAETGHFILSTMHSNNTYEAVSRIIDIFPQDQQNQVRVQLSNVLVGAISQRLLNRSDQPGRVPATEILIGTPAIRKMIAHSQYKDILEQIEKSVVHYGMQSLEQSLLALLANKMINLNEAMNATMRQSELDLMREQLGIREEGGFFHVNQQ